jgi:uncharacterized membrane protein YfcA
MDSLLFSYPVTLAIVCPMIFLAGFVDSIAGGGGLISTPAYLSAGVPVHMVLGCNKFTMSLGTGVSVFNYVRSGCVVFRVAIAGGIAALFGAWMGTQLILRLPQTVVQIALIILLPLIAISMFFNRRFGNAGQAVPLSNLKTGIIAALVGLVVGFYDGFFGPGAGMFYTLLLTGLLHLELVKAAGTTKVINFASNASSMVAFLISGKVVFAIAIPAMFCAVAGNFIGSKLAIKIGSKFIKPVILLVTLLLFVKVVTGLLQG